ncbi:MAG: M48 family metallopeptidase [Balneolaceae bacterium]|nr:M48 family metallopeptidase [Balneolaceae bacterium]
MNLFSAIILAALAVDFLLNLAADLANLRALRGELPEEFEEVYDRETYARSQVYTRERTRFGILVSVFNLGLLLFFWFLGGFNGLDQLVQSWGMGVIGTGLAWVGILVLLKGLFSLPFSLYSTFVIEEEFGFNKTTLKTYFMDRLKGLVLGAVLGGPLLAGVIAFFAYGGSLAWLYAWGAVSLFTLFVQFIAPRWIMPLFNDFEPLEEGGLRDKIRAYADEVRFALEGIYVMDGSKRSSKSNAFFTGFGKNKRIALFDTLVENHTEDELVAVLAHEVGHYKKKHILQNIAVSVAQTGVMFFLLSVFLDSSGLYEAFYMEQASVYAGLLFFGLLYAPLDMLLSLVMQAVSRRHEYQADAFAARTWRADPMISALKKLSRDNLSNLTPHPFYVFINYSHPPVLQRIRALRSVAASPAS